VAAQAIAVGRDMFIERHLIGTVAPAPETMPVTGLIDRDAIDPGAQAGLSTEPIDGGEDAEEDVLRQVERLFAIAQEVGGQLDNHALVFGHQFGTGHFVGVRAALHQRRLAAIDVNPGSDAGLLH